MGLQDGLVRLKDQNKLLLRKAGVLYRPPLTPAASTPATEIRAVEPGDDTAAGSVTPQEWRAANIKAAMHHVKRLKDRASNMDLVAV